jgi:hypothetical protein
MMAHACRQVLTRVKLNTCINEQGLKTGMPIFFLEVETCHEDNN